MVRRLVLALLCLSAAASAATSPRALKHIVEIEKVLPAAMEAADACDKALAPFRDSKDAKVVCAVQNAQIRIDCIRSVRRIVDTAPNVCAWRMNASRVKALHDSLDYYLDCVKNARDPFNGKTSGVRCFRSKVDGQLLFYVFRLPKDYDANKRYPMDVALHSGAGLVWMATWVDGKPSDDPRKANAEDRITISPCGRGNNSYSAMGETAVYDVIDDAKKHYAVDANRVTISGASMGGTGAFRLIAYRPDLFAAGSSLTGGAYYGVPKGDGRWDATLLVDNFANVGFVILDAPKEGHFKDNRAFADALRANAKKCPGFYPNLELTDPKGGHGVIDRRMVAEGKTWLRRQVRNPKTTRVVFKTYSLRYDTAYWVRIDTVEDPTKPARIDAVMDRGIRVTTENIAGFHLLVDTTVAPPVHVDGSKALSPIGYFRKVNGKWTVSEERYGAGLVKKHGLSGPVVDVFMEHPVLMVTGTLAKRDPKTQHAMVDDVVMKWLGPGDGGATLHTAFERRADVDVSAEDIRKKNLVLFGTPAQNAFVARIAKHLPAKFVAGGIEIDGKTTKGDLVMVYPNPLNPERYVVLVPEGCGRVDLKKFGDWAVGVTRDAYGGPRFFPSVKGTFSSRWTLPKR